MLKNKFPKMSIITPSYNQGKFIEQTIRSVISQDYPNLEYIVMDGGSTDNTVSILKKYHKKLMFVSERDNGQSQAINKGMKKAQGEIICFLNSDDYLEKNTLFKIAEFFEKNPQAYWCTGKCYTVDEDGTKVRPIITHYKNFFLRFARFKVILEILNFISQPATFWRREVLKNAGYFDETIHYAMDYDYWLRLMSRYKLYFIDEYLASYRLHFSSKAVFEPQKQFMSQLAIAKRYVKSPVILFLHKLHINFALFIYKFGLRKYHSQNRL